MLITLCEPGQYQLVRGPGRRIAACELAHILEVSPGTQTHLFLADQYGPMSSGKGACAVWSMLSLAARSWAPLPAVCWPLLWWLT